MTAEQQTPFNITEHEFGTLRVFAMADPNPNKPLPTVGDISDRLGPVALREDKVEIVRTRVLEGLGLAGYLKEGYGIAEPDLSDQLSALDQSDRLLIFLPASAFGGIKQTLNPDAALTFVGLFHEEKAAPPRAMEPTEAAKGALAKPEPQTVVSGGRKNSPNRIIVVGALLLAAALILYLVV